MKYLQAGKFYGNTFKRISSNGITLTETVYTHQWVDWHYHENAYFTYLLTGKMVEGSKKQKNICGKGTLLYHNCQEPHYNIKPENFTKGFHIEIDNAWIKKHKLPAGIEGAYNVTEPAVLKNLELIYGEFTKYNEDSIAVTEDLLLDIFGHLSGITGRTKKPAWLGELMKILNNRFSENPALSSLAEELNVHPVHISREFRKYYKTTLSGYLRKLKLELALKLLSENHLSLTQISFECGFSDQSHFIRWFKRLTGFTPGSYLTNFPKA